MGQCQKGEGAKEGACLPLASEGEVAGRLATDVGVAEVKVEDLRRGKAACSVSANPVAVLPSSQERAQRGRTSGSVKVSEQGGSCHSHTSRLGSAESALVLVAAAAPSGLVVGEVMMRRLRRGEKTKGAMMGKERGTATF